MKRMKCIISYDGTNFSGYQIQPGKRTVQQEIEAVLKRMHKGEEVRIYASGRTDAGVHAQGQVIHFDTPLEIAQERWIAALNTQLPEDIAVHHAEAVSPEFHARYDVVSKEYRYRVMLGRGKHVFLRHYAYLYPYSLNIGAIEAAVQHLKGTHDFTSFCSAKTEIEDKVRTIYEIDVQQQDEEMIFRFVGNGFLYNMVRIMVGTLLDVGQGKLHGDEIPSILKKMDRRLAGKTAPGHGLYLWQVNYEKF